MLTKYLKPLFVASLALSSLLLASGADAAGPNGTKSDYGSAVPAESADYAVKINASTKWINVNNGDTVRFSVNGKDFTWHFDTYKNHSIVKLASIAPADTDTGAVKVFVAMNPLYMN
jgi:hypothetical protein